MEAVRVQEENPSDEQLSILKVFSNHLLNEKIFHFAISCEAVYCDFEAIRSLRSVGKIWNDSVVNMLYRKELPFINVSVFNEENDGPLLLSSLTKTFTDSSAIHGSAIPIHLALHSEFFREECRPSLCNFLSACGPQIADMDIDFPMSGGTIKGPLKNLALPSLKTFMFGFEVCSFNERIRPASVNVASILQSIFSGATALKTLIIGDPHPRFKIFDKIVLPATLTELNLPTLPFEELEILLFKNHLPNLATLVFTILQVAGKYDFFTRILEQYRQTLKDLLPIVDHMDTGVLIPFRFPVMEKLEILDLSHCSLLRLECDPFASDLPKLRVLKLWQHTANILTSFWNRGGISLVVDLKIVSHYGVINVDAALLKRIRGTFPNLVKLSLDFWQPSVLKYIFREMIKLVDLTLRLNEFDGTDSDVWDSLFIGIPIEAVEDIRAGHGHFGVDPPETFGLSSIRNLKDLRRLSLFGSASMGRPRGRPLISDLSFHFALLRMPQLKELNFSGIFFASPEITEIWKQQGRVLKDFDLPNYGYPVAPQ